jgi:hypothetical protein
MFDITLIGGINLSVLKQKINSSAVGGTIPEVPNPAAKAPVTPVDKEIPPPETKKKNNVKSESKVSRPSKPHRKQGYLKYLGIMGFLILFMMIYFRKSIMRILFEGEITFQTVSLISPAEAQETIPDKKKRITESSVQLEKITFWPHIGLNGLLVKSSLNVEEINCKDLENDVNQLGIVLYPPEIINEKFLIKIRECVLKLSEDHVLKRWIKWIAKSRPVSKTEQEKQNFLVEIINSPFNLITDNKIRDRIIKVISETPESTLPEKLLRSYLYMMIGNITHSDNILKQIMTIPPRVNWEMADFKKSLSHVVASEHMEKIFLKFARHPTDRRCFQLLILYFQNFFNDEYLLKISDNVDTNDVESKLELKYIRSLAPDFVDYLRLSSMSENDRIAKLRKTETYPLDMQSYWIWAFQDIDPLVSEQMTSELHRIEKEDEMWFIYLLNNEKLADIYSLKKGKSFLPGHRSYLKKNLEDHHSFMLSLYMLIQIGDINHEVLLKTTENLIHD